MKTTTYVAIVFVALYGYLHNIYNILHADGGVTGKLILQIIGVFMAPLGVIMGYL